MDMNQPQPVPAETRPETPSPAIRHGWIRALLFLPIYFILTVLQGIVAVILVNPENMSSASEEVMGAMHQAVGIPVQGFALATTLLGIWLFTRYIDRRPFVSLGFSLKAPFGRHLAAGFAWGIGLIVAVFLISLAFGWIEITGLQWPIKSLIIVLPVIVFAATMEEVFLRGYMLKNLMDSMNKYVALILSSVLFALFHALNPNVSWLGLLNIVAAGLLLGIYYVHRQNLWLPITLHIAWNYFQGPVLGSPVSGVALPSVLSLEFTGADLLTGGRFGFEASLLTTLIMLVAVWLIHRTYFAKKPTVPGSPGGSLTDS